MPNRIRRQQYLLARGLHHQQARLFLVFWVAVADAQGHLAAGRTYRGQIHALHGTRTPLTDFQSRDAILRPTGPTTAEVELIAPEDGVSAGQACVFYAGDVVLGGGRIVRAEAARPAGRESALVAAGAD